MTIDLNPTPAQLEGLHDDLKAYEALIATYLSSDAGQADPGYVDLARADIQLNLQLYNLSNTRLQLAGEGASAAVDAINAAVGALNDLIAHRARIAGELVLAQAAANFALALNSGQLGTIGSAGGALLAAAKGLRNPPANGN